MAIVEFALAYDFVEPVDTSVAYRLEFLYDGDEVAVADLAGVDPLGQVRAVVRGFHPRRGSIVAVSRSGVRYSAVLNAIGRLWPWRGGYEIDLTQIRERLRDAGLDAPVRVVSERE